MHKVVVATAAKKQCPIIHVATEHGLPWDDYMRELAKSNAEEVGDGFDSMSGLRLFVLAAMGKQ